MAIHTLEGLDSLRTSLNHGVGIDQATLDGVSEELRPLRDSLRPGDNAELLPVFDRQGHPLGTHVERWLGHLLGIRHCCNHLFVFTQNHGQLWLLLQVRSFEKSDSPGAIDASVGGHQTVDGGLEAELSELGLKPEDFIGEGLRRVNGYDFIEAPRIEQHFFNVEYRHVHVGEIGDVSQIRFADGEVAGMLMMPVTTAPSLLQQTTLPIASALRQSLMPALEYLAR